ncbi:hypothetical protein [Calothrix sp. UHCC 0171]|uniref:hypothetical protein n=1 Tax=Calothrix sp. UHCC 0171 TaxID=3110245 RepID=UPI002B219B69|nr:hypothetical protein [Calothrix sp. UHCC 0171]MEA5573910.1 hypothetical protein [Calothrix sp. UHCC 0171]
MASPSRKTNRQSSQNPNVPIVKRVVKKNGKKPKKSSRLTSLLAVVFLLGIGSLVVAFAWISFLFIFNPQQVTWLNKLLPGWAQIHGSTSDRPLTLPQIQAAISKQGNIPGEQMLLAGDINDSFLLPIYKQRQLCQSDCQEIIELRVYQHANDGEFSSNSPRYYQIVAQIAIAGPEESFVISPIVNATDANPGSSISLPVTEIKRLEGATSTSGIWYYLRGQRQESAHNLAYGHILYYNPQRFHLQQMQSWTSSQGQIPQWQQVTGNNTKELVINQTVGLEPQLRVYQVKSVNTFLNPVELEEIDLKPKNFSNYTYKKALAVASNGLWTPAFESLQSLKKQQKNIPATVQAQIDLIRLHSQLTQTQANTTWASPGQQVLVNLIDGRWDKALQVFKASPPENAKEISALLKADNGKLWSRVNAALQLNPNRGEVQAWGALILAAQQGEAQAYSWLKEEFKGKQVNLAEIATLLRQLKGEVTAKPEFFGNHTSRIIGSAAKIKQINPREWLTQTPSPFQAEESGAVQNWYLVNVSAFHNGKNWLFSPFTSLNLPKTTPEKFLRSQLGLDTDSLLQIAVLSSDGEQQTTSASIKAMQLKNGKLQLLATAVDSINSNNSNNSNSQALALTASALEWVEPSPVTLAQLQQQNPQRGNKILPAIWRSLQASNQLRSANIPNVTQLLQKIGHYPIQEIDLTGNGKPEIVLTVSAEAITSLQSGQSLNNSAQKQFHPRTVILAENGSIIYTDFSKSSEQTLIAIANLWQTSSPTLLVENINASGKNYTLKRWSSKNQHFE